MDRLCLSGDELESCAETIASGIREFVNETGAKGAVFGLSGGIDSALVGALGKSALGDRIRCLIMPEEGVSSRGDVEHALSFAKSQGIPAEVIEIKQTLDSIRGAYPKMMEEGDGFLARANLAPRVRMIFNYASSNLDDLIVLGTGNKTEILLGYFTKHGDGGVDFLPIGDLYKTQVIQLACHVGIPDCITEKPPSAGLWHGQTDEDEIGESYENIDNILFLLTERRCSVEQAASTLELDRAKVEMIAGMMGKNLHKSRSPKAVKIW